jgi:replicative DNA helicase
MDAVEQAAVGAALFAVAEGEFDRMLTVALRSADFADPQARAIWQSLYGMAQRRMRADPLTLIADLGEDYRRTIAEVAGGSYSVKNLAAYAERVKREAKRRAFRAVFERADLRDDPDTLIRRALSDLVDLSRETPVREHDMESLMRDVGAYVHEVSETASSGGTIGVPTGMRDLDDAIGGLHRSDLIVLAGRPKMGKSAAVLTMALNAARRGHRVGVVSAEMAALQLGLRAAAGVSGVSMVKLRNGRLGDADYPALTGAQGQLAKLPINMIDPAACTPADIVRQAHAWEARGMELLMVDYLGRLKPDRDTGSRTRDVGEMVRSMKELAKSLNIPVVLLSQLNRDLESRPDKRPHMADLRDSGEIEQEADVILFLYRDCVYDSDADPKRGEIIIGANRHGPIGVLPMGFDAERMLWCDPDLV